MYAIRSYYVTNTVSPESFSLVAFGRDAVAALVDEAKKLSVFVAIMLVLLLFNLIPVITSYSIHYTKLYDGVVST